MRSLIKKLIPKSLFEKIEPTGHFLEALVANILTGFPARNLKVIGVTGTDGKTTTSTLITTMLRSAGYKVGMMTTISIDTGSGPRPNPTRLTTISSLELFKKIREMKNAGVEWLVLEVTSHALAQNRAWGVPFTIAVMTNVTHEHLDYHKTFENYRAAKLRLFELTSKNKIGIQAGVVNADDPSAELFAGATPHPITYGIDKGDLMATGINADATGTSFVAAYHSKTLALYTSLPGHFNIYNALAAAATGLVIGLSKEQIEKGIASLTSVEGRMNRIDEGQNFNVIVDYAHTPDSFKKIFAETRPITKGRLISVFGSAGHRDIEKRAIQGKVAGEMTDIVVATEEDDRTEDGDAILERIARGAESAGKKRGANLFLIHDRSEAIRHAVKIAEPGDTILLLGKGHEKSIETNTGKKDWDEIEEARKAIRARAGR